ncbi:MAG: hypothetical protein HYS12_11700 [Planctomycetes bacterium]|nr:hypothetical protein [Planctomycetota bacterium]
MAFAHRCGLSPRLPVVALVAALILGPAGAVCGQESSSLKERFLTEAPKAWEDYWAFAERLSGTHTWQSTHTEPNGKVFLTTTWKYQVKQKDDHRLFAVEVVEGSGSLPTRVEAANPRYAFQLTRPEGKTDWILSKLDLKVLDGSTVSLGGLSLRELIREQISGHFVAERHTLAYLIRRPTFKVLRASAVTRDGRELVRIDFDNAHPWVTPSERSKFPKKYPPFDPVQSGSLLLDPDHSWCLAESEIVEEWMKPDNSGPFRRPVKYIYEYREGTDRFPILTRIVTQAKRNPELNVRGWEFLFEFDLRESPEPEDEEFTLTAYGLPEPVGMELPRRSRAWLWFGLAAVAVLGVGFLFRRAARRRAAAQPAGARTAVLK